MTESAMDAPLDLAGQRRRVLWLSTFAFTVLFAVWLMLGVLGLKIKTDRALVLGEAAASLSDAEAKAAIEGRFEWALAISIFAGAILRLNFGLWADKYGGRNVMVGLLAGCAVPTAALAYVQNYWQLLACAALFGLAGNSFSVGIAWNSAWFPPAKKGAALGLFGAGNVGAAGTKLLVVLVPGVLAIVPAAGWLGGLIPGGWRVVPLAYAVLLLATAAAILCLCPARDPRPGRGRPLGELLAPLKHVRVWRFGLYYVVVFGAYVALSAWLPNYYSSAYGLDLRTAALLTATFIFPASLLRPAGGWLSDRYGPRVVTYGSFAAILLASLPLCFPASVLPIGAGAFAGLMFVVGVGMGVGKASVFKYIPDYFPADVGAVGGLVGTLGALGGFWLPKAFGMLSRATGYPQAAFMALVAMTGFSLAWLVLAVRTQASAARILRERSLAASAPAPALAAVESS